MLKLFLQITSAVLLTYCGCLLTASCSHNPHATETLKTYTLDNVEPGDIHDIFSDVTLAELQFDGESYPRGISKLLVDSNRVFILGRNVIYVYSSDGKIISSSMSKYGNGPGEFSVLMGFSWNPFSKNVEVVTPEKIMFYDENFNFIRESKLKTKFGTADSKSMLYQNVFDLSPTLHILHPTGVSESPNRFMVYDSTTEEILSEISYEEDVIAQFNQQPVNFFRLPDGKVMCHPKAIVPYTYEFDTQSYTLTKKIMLDLGSNEISKDDVDSHNTNSYELLLYLKTCDKYIPLKTLISSDRLIVTVKQSDINTDEFILYYSGKKPNGLKFNWCNSDSKQIFPSLYYIDEYYAYAMNMAHYIKDDPSIVLDDPEKIKQLEAMDDESWVLLKYKFRT